MWIWPFCNPVSTLISVLAIHFCIGCCTQKKKQIIIFLFQPPTPSSESLVETDLAQEMAKNDTSRVLLGREKKLLFVKLFKWLPYISETRILIGLHQRVMSTLIMPYYFYQFVRKKSVTEIFWTFSWCKSIGYDINIILVTSGVVIYFRKFA